MSITTEDIDVDAITDRTIDRWIWLGLCDRPQHDGARVDIYFEAKEYLNIERLPEKLWNRIDNRLEQMKANNELIEDQGHQLILVNDPNEQYWKQKKTPTNFLAKGLYAIGYWITGD